MLNLDHLMNRSVKIKLNDSVVNVQELTQKMFEELVGIEQLQGAEALEAQKTFLLKALNRNSSGKKFTIKEIDEFPRVVLLAIWNALVSSSLNTVTDPN